MYPDEKSRSAALFARAQAVLPGGNSRHSLAFAPYPIYAAAGEGCMVTDVDGASYIDCINNMSANIHGHRHPAVMEAATRQMEKLVSVGLPTEAEVTLAELMVARVDSVESIRFANSGTEALMFAVRAARAFTGRDLVAKIEGGYHGSYDALDVSNKPPAGAWGELDAPATVRESAGLTAGSVADTLVLPVNRVEATRALIERHGDRLAAIVLDPLVSRMGFLPLTAAYLAMVREETARRGIVLIMDEVFSFRLGPQGAQGAVGVRPDLSTFGKIIGGGFPIGAVGGRADIMDVFNHLPKGKPRVEHSGTFNANPVSMAAGAAALKLLDEAAFARLERLGDQLRDGLRGILKELSMPGQAPGQGSLLALLLHDRPVSDYRSFVETMTTTGAAREMAAFHRAMVNRGVLPVFPAAFILSTAMSEAVVDRILTAARESLRDVRDQQTAAA
ncbi:aspartate aminotransferase family protein [Phenylobacterium sp.]|uniref:aspartate aminotransferase family protein n=1 Tax=Phenylobacterium sp. TaxID=1871053 RepID=UPI0035B3F275